MQRWVCLLYHDVRPEPARSGGGPERFAVPLGAFERQLDCIRAEGLHGCTIAEAIQRQDRRVAISFDDGDAGQYEFAFPALAARGMTATFFITTAWVGRPGYVTWQNLREMKAAGMSIQSHTVTHPFMSELDAHSLAAELTGSKSALDMALTQDTDTIALPGGDEPRADLRALFVEAGYRVVATSRWGTNHPNRTRADDALACLARCTVQGEPSTELFRRVMRGDSWLLGWQRTRGAVLRGVRSGMGPGRYAALRRRLLNSLAALR